MLTGVLHLSSLTRITESTGDIVHLNEFRPTLFRDEANHLFLGLEILRFTRITGSLGDKYGDEARPLGKDRDVADWVEVLKASVSVPYPIRRGKR